MLLAQQADNVGDRMRSVETGRKDGQATVAAMDREVAVALIAPGIDQIVDECGEAAAPAP